jgi:hypothetical protein
MYGFTATASQPATQMGLKRQSQGKGRAALPSDYFSKLKTQDLPAFLPDAAQPVQDVFDQEEEKEEENNLKRNVAIGVSTVILLGGFIYFRKR